MTFASVQDNKKRARELRGWVRRASGRQGIGASEGGAKIRLSLLATIFVAVAADLGRPIVVITRSPDRGADRRHVRRSSARVIVVSEILSVMDEA